MKRGFLVLVILSMFLLAACATIQITPEEKSKEPCVSEKKINVTKYKEERKPYGTPRCEQFVYNFSKTYTYSEGVVNNVKVATCTYLVKNEEDMDGTFNFYPNLLKTGKINDGTSITKLIPAFGTVRFEWNFTLEPTETASCLLQCGDCPERMRCFYLEPITYQIKQVPYTIEMKKNVTTC